MQKYAYIHRTIYPVHGANMTQIQPVWSAYPYALGFPYMVYTHIYIIMVVMASQITGNSFKICLKACAGNPPAKLAIGSPGIYWRPKTYFVPQQIERVDRKWYKSNIFPTTNIYV